MLKRVRLLGLMLSLVSGVPAVWAQSAPKPAAKQAPAPVLQTARSAPVAPATPPAPPAMPPASTSVSKLALTVAQLGALRCVERADQLAKFLNRSGTEVLIVDRTPADMVTATLLVPLEDGSHSTVEINLIPTANGCSAYYAATSHALDNCPQAEEKLYGELPFKPLENLPYRLAMISAGARVLSRQLPTGCLLTKHEVIR